MNAARLSVAVVTTVAGLAALAYASAVPLPYHPADSAALRLSWSARPERIEVCRTLSDDELAKVAEHMRQRVSCEGVFATYALRTEVDDELIGESVVRGAGLRNDRPLYLLRDYPIPPGRHRVRVSLLRREKATDDTTGNALSSATTIAPEVDTGLYAGRSARELNERERRTRAAIPASLVLDTVVVIAPNHVALVTFNVNTGALELQAGPPPAY